jgi:hypothetical protein
VKKDISNHAIHQGPQDSIERSEGKISGKKDNESIQLIGKSNNLEEIESTERLRKDDDLSCSKVPKTTQPPTSLKIDTSFIVGSPKKSKSQLDVTPTQFPKYSPIGPRRDRSVGKITPKPNTIQEDDSFSVSAESISSASQFSEVESVSQPLQDKQIIAGRDLFRPPPGLAPPPGFASTDKLQIPTPDHTLIPSKQLSSTSEVPDLPLPPNSLLSTLLGNQEDFNLSDNDINLQERQDEAARYTDTEDDKPLGSGPEFNVMNFLSFLDEGVHTHDEGSNARIEDETHSSMLYGTSITTVQSNPWGGSGKPRALAYGIEVEAGNNKEGINGNDGIQLLTPSIILGQNNDSLDRMEEDETNEDRIFNFANLFEE